MNKTIAATLLTLLTACSTNDSSSQQTSSSDPRAFCRAAAEQTCRTMYRCLTDEEKRSLGLPDDETACAREYESACQDHVGDCDDDAHAFDQATAGACLDEMHSAACNDAAEPWLDAPSCDEQLCQRTAGAFRVTWDLNGYYCEETNVHDVGLVVTGPGGHETTTKWACGEYSGVTDPLPLGAYTLRLEAYDGDGYGIWASDPVMGELDDAFVDMAVSIPVGG